jgi:hypothetical protein
MGGEDWSSSPQKPFKSVVALILSITGALGRYFFLEWKHMHLSKHTHMLMTHSQLLEGLKCESKWKTLEEGGVGTRSLAHNTLRGRGACWSSGMGLGKIDKLIHSHGPAHNTHKVVSA